MTGLQSEFRITRVKKKNDMQNFWYVTHGLRTTGLGALCEVRTGYIIFSLVQHRTAGQFTVSRRHKPKVGSFIPLQSQSRLVCPLGVSSR